jgi:hypothetical protein
LRQSPAAPEVSGASSRHDWPRLLDAAARHGVLGPLESSIVASPAFAADDQVELERCLVAQRVHQTLVRATTLEAVEALADVGIPTAVLKGPLLGERLYGPGVVRPSLDVDLLLAASDVPAAVERLGQLGYRSGAAATFAYLLQHHHHVVLYATARPPIELHFRLYTGFGVRVPAEPFLSRSEPEGRGRCRILSPADEVLYLGLHAAGHGFERLGWLHDLHHLAVRLRPTDWELARARAQELGVASAFGFALEEVRARLGAAVPPPGPCVRRYRSRWTLTRRWLDWVGDLDAASPRTTLGLIVLQSLLCDDAAGSAKHLAHHLGRILRRRAHRHFPRWASPAWAG